MAVPKRTGAVEFFQRLLGANQVGSAAHDQTSSDSCDRGTADVLCPRRQGTRREPRSDRILSARPRGRWRTQRGAAQGHRSVHVAGKPVRARYVSTSARNGRAHHERHASLRQRAARDRRTGGHAGRGIGVVFGQRQRNAAGPPRRAAAQPVLRRQFIERHALQRHLGLRRRCPRVCAAGQQLRAAHHRRDESGSAVSPTVRQHVGWRPASQRPDMEGRRHQSRSGLG